MTVAALTPANSLDRSRPAMKASDPRLRELRHQDAAAAADVADWLSYLKVSNKATRTQEGYRNTAELLLREFPDTPLHEMTSGQITYVLGLIPPRSRHQHRSHFASLFNWAWDDRRIPENPMSRVPRIKYEPDRVYDIFSEAEVEAACSLPLPDGPLMELLFWGGLRRAEARLLQVKRVDLDRRQIVVIDGAKRSKSRTVPLLSRVESAVSELMLIDGLGRDDYLWYGRRGNQAVSRLRRDDPIQRSAFGKWWKECLEEAGVRYRRPHLARHTYATMLRRRGVPIEDVQAFLGHASVRTTIDTYVHATDDERADRLRAIFEGC